MIPPGLHVPPRYSAAADNVSAGPPPTSIFLSFPSAKNPIDRLSGDQNGPAAPSVPGSSCGATLSSDRMNRRLRPVAGLKRNAMRRPSGETATDAVVPVELVRDGSNVNVHPSGGDVTNRRVSGTAGRLRTNIIPPRAADTTSNTPAAIQPALPPDCIGTG